MRTHKPTHLPPLSAEEQDALQRSRDDRTGLPVNKNWWGGVRWQRNKKYGRGRHHKGRDLNGRMIPDSGAR